MAGPFDYSIQQPDITGSLMGGIQAGQQYAANRDAREASEAARLKEQQYREDLEVYLKNPTFKGTADFIAKHPGSEKPFKASWEIRSKGQNDQIFGTGIQALNALDSNRPDVAMKLFDDQIAAMENSGEDANDFKAIRDSIERNPAGAKGIIGLSLASYNPDGFSKIAQERRDEAKAPYELGKAKAESGIKQVEAQYAPERQQLASTQTRADLRNIDSQIRDRSRRMTLDEDRLQSDVDAKLNEFSQKATTLDAGATKLLNDSVVASIAADQSASRLDDLAGQLEAAGGGYGAASTAGEWLKKVGGFQNGMTDIRNEYTRIRTSEAIKSLPAGPATDKDIQLALKGIPDSSADSETISRFLRGMAKLSRVTSIGESAKSEWVNAVGNLGKPKNDIVIDGVNVPKGATYQDFTRNYVKAKSEQRDVEAGQAQVPNRSYMRFVKPGGQ